MKGKTVVFAVAAALVAAGCGDSSDSDTTAAKSDNAACTPKYKAQGKESGTLRVAAIQFPPYSMREGGQLDGIDGDIMEGFAKAACLKVTTTETTFAAAVSSLTSDRADVAMGSLYPTKDRAKEVIFSNPGYLDFLGIASKSGVKSIAEAKKQGLKFGAGQGTYYVPALKKIFGSDFSVFPDNTKMYQALTSGRIDVTIDSYPAAAAYLKKRGKLGEYKVEIPAADSRIPGTGTDKTDVGLIAYALQKSATGLRDALNQYLDDIRSSGKLAEILQKWDYSTDAADPGPLRLLCPGWGADPARAGTAPPIRSTSRSHMSGSTRAYAVIAAKGCQRRVSRGPGTPAEPSVALSVAMSAEHFIATTARHWPRLQTGARRLGETTGAARRTSTYDRSRALGDHTCGRNVRVPSRRSGATSLTPIWSRVVREGHKPAAR